MYLHRYTTKIWAYVDIRWVMAICALSGQIGACTGATFLRIPLWSISKGLWIG